jgi:cytochrome b6-f complex iron-sulfur subunit
MRLSLWPAIFGLALAMIVVTIIQPVPSSLSYASGVLVIIALLGWILEAREVAGPAPEVEAEHEEEEEEAPGPSYWPVILSIGIVGIASGLIYNWEYGALIIAVPLAMTSGLAWATKIAQEMAEAEAAYIGDPIVGPSGQPMFPVPANVLTAQAAGGAAIALETSPAAGGISRRGVLRFTFWTGLLGGLAAMGGSIVDMLYPRGITGFGSVINAGLVADFPEGTKTQNFVGKFWLVHLTEAEAKQSDPANGKAGFLALWWKCPHLGCTVPWRQTFTFNDRQGWFRCPCHGSTYDDAGARVFGPAPRSMDRMQVTIADGKISVNTGAITKGTTDNASFTVEG